MPQGPYAKWMTAWETKLTTQDTNRVVRPLEWGFDWLDDFAHRAGVPVMAEVWQRAGLRPTQDRIRQGSCTVRMAAPQPVTLTA